MVSEQLEALDQHKSGIWQSVVSVAVSVRSWFAGAAKPTPEQMHQLAADAYQATGGKDFMRAVMAASTSEERELLRQDWERMVAARKAAATPEGQRQIVESWRQRIASSDAKPFGPSQQCK